MRISYCLIARVESKVVERERLILINTKWSILKGTHLRFIGASVFKLHILLRGITPKEGKIKTGT